LVDAFSVLEEGTKFADSWYFGAVCEHAEAILSGQLRRLVVTQPPGTLKSLTWNVFFPAWTWIEFPQVRFLIAGHDQTNASENAVKCRNLIKSGWYQNSFAPDWRLAGDQDAKLFYQNTRGGHRMSLSVGGSPAGKKGHVLIVDDLHDPVTVHSEAQRRADKEWFRLGFSDRMMNFKTAALVVIGHRLRKDDLEGDLLEEGWPELRLPEELREAKRKLFPVACELEEGAPKTDRDPREEGDWLRPERFGPNEKKGVIEIGGELAYTAKHEQEPQDRKGQMFDPGKVKIVPGWPTGTVSVWYWDTAASEEESACDSCGVHIGKKPDGTFIILEVISGRFGPTERNNHMRNNALASMHLPGLRMKRLYWEKGTSDSGLERDRILARHLAGIPCAADRAKGPKVERAEGLAAQWAAGNVELLDGPWNRFYLGRMADFPLTRHKDQTDASSGGFNKLALGLSDDAYITGTEADTVHGGLPHGTYDPNPQGDPYA
jgi:predicted phage terminase large subunit-like protein